MDNVLMTIVAIAIVLYPRKDTFIERFKFKAGLKGVEVDISTKEKGDPPYKDDHLNKKI